MGAIGGDILEITYNHPKHGSGTIFPKAAEDSTINLGGLRSADDANMVTGNGEMIDQMNNTRWSVETVVAWDMNVRAELEKLNDLAGDPVPASWTFTHVSGVIYGGSGKPVGELGGNGNQATFQLKVAGGGKLKKL